MVIRKKEHFFYTCNGKSLKSIKEMLEWLKNTTNDNFYYHVNLEKNDFQEWIKKVLRDRILSKQISEIKDKNEMIKVVEKRIESKTKKTKKGVISQIKNAMTNG